MKHQADNGPFSGDKSQGDRNTPSWPSVFAVILGLGLGPVMGPKFSANVGGTRPHQSNSTSLSASLAAVTRNSGGVRGHKGRSTFLAAVTRLSRNSRGVRFHKGRSTFLAASLTTAARPARFPRSAPTFATSNGRPAVCLIWIEVFRRWRGGVVAFGIVRTIDVKWQGRVVFRIGFLVVLPLLLLGCLGPLEVAGKRGLGEPVVGVRGLNEALRE